MVSNHGNGSITMLDFGNSILNTPVAGTPISSGSGSVKDAVFAKICGNWYAFLGCNNGLKRADFGNSLANAPVINTVVGSGSISDIALIMGRSKV